MAIKKRERLTQRNHGQKNHGAKTTYRIWMDKAGDNCFKTQQHELFMFGDIADRLGELEDFIEELERGGVA